MNKNLDNQVEDEQPIVVLTEEDGRSLPCFIERSVDVDNVNYVLLLPVDTPIEILAWEPDEEVDDDEVLVDVDSNTVQEIFSTAKAVLAEHNLVLSNTALTLTVSGDIPEPSEEDVITLDIGDDPGDELNSEELQLLASFFHKEQEYAIYTPLDPLLFFARMGTNGQPNVLSPEEFERVRPYLENHLFDEVDDE